MMISVISMIWLYKYIKKSDISSFQWSSFYAPSPHFPLQQKTISQKTKKNTSNNTVDGRKPAPPGMYKTR